MEVEAESRRLTQEATGREEIPQELLRKYILYARERCSPRLMDMEEEKMGRLYADMRKESRASGGYPVTVSFP